MRVALVAPPFIPVPPRRYGGTELFLAHLARGLQRAGHEPVLYTNGDSTQQCEKRWLYPHMQWPLPGEVHGNLSDLNHASWACKDALRDCDILHLNNAPGLSLSRLVPLPVVYTLHHPYLKDLSGYYNSFPGVWFVAISKDQASRERMARISVAHHGIDAGEYRMGEGPRDYLLFLGRIAPMKGVHHAIEVARRTGIPLKIAGEIQPLYQKYWEEQIRPQVDGSHIQYVGEADHTTKVELLAGARALLVPIEWDEPFGLVMVEAMACGAPVLGFPRGSVPEIVCSGVSGEICAGVDDMAAKAISISISPQSCRDYVERNFSIERMTAAYLQVYNAALEEQGKTLSANLKRAS